jgi:hypothetical protein
LLYRLIAACKHLRPWHTALVRVASRGYGRDLAILINEFEVVAGEQMGNGRKLRTVTLSVVVEFEQWYSEKLHILRDAQDLCEW